MIGIAYTVHNRNESAQYAINKMREFLPPDAILIIVDDASKVPFPDATYRFEENVGVAVAKNKCLELLQDCDHIFLFDDDVWPITKNWHLFYISSRLNHACMTFRRKVLGIGDGYVEYEKPCGCMLYIRRICLATVGGFDTEFTGYSYEHVNWSDRIYNAGLTPNRYIDIPESSNILYSLDLNHEIESSFNVESRRMIPHNYKLQQEKFLSKEFKPYK